MKAIGKLREEGQRRYFFLISLSSSPILSRQPLPWNHFVDSPQPLISFNVQVVRTAKYAYFASYLDYKLVRLLSYFSWNIHSIHLTPVNENLFRHWFSVAIIRGRSRTVYQSGREKRRDESFQVRARSENRYVFQRSSPNCSKARRSTKERAVLGFGSWKNYVIITRLQRKLKHEFFKRISNSHISLLLLFIWNFNK